MMLCLVHVIFEYQCWNICLLEHLYNLLILLRDHCIYSIYCLIQAKILYKATPFSEDESENIKMKIQSNVYGYLGILLEGRERFEDESLIEMRKTKSYHNSDSIGVYIFVKNLFMAKMSRARSCHDYLGIGMLFIQCAIMFLRRVSG